MGVFYYKLCGCCIPRFARGADGENLNRTRRVKVPLLINLASFCSSGKSCSTLERLGLVQLRPLNGAQALFPVGLKTWLKLEKRVGRESRRRKIWRKRTVNVNVLMGALGMETARLVRSTIGKMGLVLIAGRPGMRAERNS